jgi:hypothetical protein
LQKRGESKETPVTLTDEKLKMDGETPRDVAIDRALKDVDAARAEIENRITPEADAAYLEHVKAGRTEEAQKMVDEEAKKYIQRAIHEQTIPLDHFDTPSPKANISHFGWKEPGYYSLGSAAKNEKGISDESFESVLKQAKDAGYSVESKEVDGYGKQRAYLIHDEAQKILAMLLNHYNGKRANALPVFVRYGRLPPGGKSRNYRDNLNESGVSVFRGTISPNGEVEVQPKHTYEAGTLLMGDMKSRPLYVVKGKEIGVGSDGEPILSNAKIFDPIKYAQEAFKNTPQLKGHFADPVTRDDAGRVIPLSERFNEKNPDIRFSLPNLRETIESDGVRWNDVTDRPIDAKDYSIKDKQRWASEDEFKKDFAENADHESQESWQEFLKRRACGG